MQDPVVLLVTGAELPGDTDHARAVLQSRLVQHIPPDIRQRQERRPAAVALLQKANGALCILLAADHDVLHGRAQGRLNRDRIFARDLDQAGNRSMDSRKGAVLGLFHHQLDALGKALQVALQILQQPGPAGAFVGVQMELFTLLLGGFRALAAGIQPHLISFDRVGKRLDAAFRISQHLGKVRIALF